MKIRDFLNAERKIIASNYISLVGLQAVNYLLPLILLPYLVRVLGAEIFGLIMLAQAIAMFLLVFVDFGFNISGTREVSILRDKIDMLSEFFNSVIFIKIVLTIISFIFLLILVTVVPKFNAYHDVYLYSFGIVIGQALLPVWFFQGIETMRILAILGIVSKIIFALLIFLFVRNQTDYLLVPIFISLGYIVGGVLGLILAYKKIKFLAPRKSIIINITKESSILFVSNFAVAFYTASNVIILGSITNNILVGIFASMEKFILAAKNMYVPFYQALFPYMAKKDNYRKINLTKKLILPMAIIGLFISIMFFLFSREIVEIIYNDQAITEYNIIMKILSLIALFSGLSMLFNYLFFPSIKNYNLRMKILVIGGVFNIIFGIITTWKYGIFGIATTILITEFLLMALGFYYFYKHLRK